MSSIVYSTGANLNSGADNSIAHAFQHTYWNVLMYKHLGELNAEKFATAHENFEDNPRLPKAMDLYNNEKDEIMQISLIIYQGILIMIWLI